MNQQVLGGLTTLAQKASQANQAAITAQQMAANAQTTASAATGAIAALQVGQSLTFLSSFVTFVAADLTFDNNWHQLGVHGIPANATALYVGGYVVNQGSPDNARQYMLVRPGAGGQQVLLSQTNGVNGGYENDSAIGPCFIPCNNGMIQYKWSNAVTDTNFVVYGYLSPQSQ